MSIYAPLSSPDSKSLAASQWQTNNDLSRLIGGNLDQLAAIYANGYVYVNNNPYGLTVPQVVMGVGAVDWQRFYTEAVWMKSLINHVSPGKIVDHIGEATISATVSGSTVSLTITPTSACSPQGTVTFKNGNTVLGYTLVTGGTTLCDTALPNGDYSITVDYSGDVNLCPIHTTISITIA